MSKYLMILGLLGTVWMAQAATPSDSLVAFFVGIEALRSTPGLTVEQKARQYRELEKVCGIRGKDAVALLATYRDDPQKWKEINERMQAVVNKLDSVDTQTQ